MGDGHWAGGRTDRVVLLVISFFGPALLCLASTLLRTRMMSGDSGLDSGP